MNTKLYDAVRRVTDSGYDVWFEQSGALSFWRDGCLVESIRCVNATSVLAEVLRFQQQHCASGTIGPLQAAPE